jgi:hypothetical protein
MNTAVRRGVTGQAKRAPPSGQKSSQMTNSRAKAAWPMPRVRMARGVSTPEWLCTVVSPTVAVVAISNLLRSVDILPAL